MIYYTRQTKKRLNSVIDVSMNMMFNLWDISYSLRHLVKLVMTTVDENKTENM